VPASGHAQRPVLLAFLALLGFLAAPATASTADRLDFTVRVGGIATDLPIFLAVVSPGDTLALELSGVAPAQLVVETTAGRMLDSTGLVRRHLVPREPGHHTLTVRRTGAPQTFQLNVFVRVPAGRIENGRLDGYRIGDYPEKLFRGDPAYRAPSGFIEVTPENRDLRISPHFRLEQFLCKQQREHWPKYLLLRPRLIAKLELLLQRLGERGIAAETVVIMSGYRTPWYNASIGNGRYSRHIYGDAADIYIDDDGDGVIDDLNGDGRASMADAEVIAEIIEEIQREPGNAHLIGGMATYPKTAAHTWDVHVDTRGYPARW
jgi:hypothetical protein